MKFPPTHFQKPQQGFVILFTILISTIILLIGFGIFSIATRETVLSSTAREAQFAFYAADAGVECALYAQSLPGGGPLVNGGSFDCGGTSITVTGNGQILTPFEFNVSVGTGTGLGCAHVSVVDINAGTARRVFSQGYNICDSSGEPIDSNPLLVERDLDTIYAIGGGPVVPSGTGTGAGTGTLSPLSPSTPLIQSGSSRTAVPGSSVGPIQIVP